MLTIVKNISEVNNLNIESQSYIQYTYTRWWLYGDNHRISMFPSPFQHRSPDHLGWSLPRNKKEV